MLESSADPAATADPQDAGGPVLDPAELAQKAITGIENNTVRIAAGRGVAAGARAPAGSILCDMSEPLVTCR